MFRYLYHLSDMELFFLLIIASMSISIAAVFLVRRYIPFRLRKRDNNVIGNISALVGLIYGVLAGMTALYLINNLSDTLSSVQNEANAAADIYRDSKWFNEPTKTRIQTDLKTYLNEVINTEWPQMKEGLTVGGIADITLEKLADELYLYNSKASNSEFLVLRDMLENIKGLYDARQIRINNSHSELSSEIWIVIFIGSFLTMSIVYLFGMHFYLHLLTASATALITSAMVFLLITMDKPFQGEFSVEPDALKSILILMDHDNKVAANIKKSSMEIPHGT